MARDNDHEEEEADHQAESILSCPMYDRLEDVPSEMALKNFSSLCFFFCSDVLSGRSRGTSTIPYGRRRQREERSRIEWLGRLYLRTVVVFAGRLLVDQSINQSSNEPPKQVNS
jgi:hypothetical protein